ncbi:response regulator transcription factor [Acaryochloris marina]|uniref:response regulator n=1 Tax=Acaryochloris marina TaxID=155978 RepID=UPI001BAECA0A|nr:response regulator transcription factor [Acaryochloris marina]QUY45503.1 response regulator transcription factor [Acaryochloris marina S15]
MNIIRIVIIEDHTLTRMGLLGALEEQDNFEVVGEAATGSEGLKLLEDIQPDVAIVDIGLPDFDGIELVQRFRKVQSEGEGAATKVLILTMHHQEVEVLAAFAAGADSYCVKDTDIELLVEAVSTTAEGHSWIDPAIASIVLEQARKGHLEGTTTTNYKGELDAVTIHGLDPDKAQLLQTSPLTERELEVLELIVGGHSNTAISESLFMSMGTVKTHVRNILSKLCASDRTEAAVRALRAGLVK